MATQGAHYTKGLSNFDGYPGPSSISPRKLSEVDNSLFWWVHRFEKRHTTFEIGYGDRELLIETMLYYKGIKDHFNPWEILEAARVPDKLIVTGEMWVHAPDFMKRIIIRISEGLIKHWGLLSSPSEEVIDRALVLRGKRMVFAQEEQHRQDRESACIKASAAFHAGDPIQAFRLLEPFEHDKELARSSKMILDIARKRT